MKIVHGLDPLTCGSSKENMLKRKPSERISIKEFAFWESYPKDIVGAITKHVQSKEKSTNDIINTDENNETPTVFINIGRVVWWIEALRTNWKVSDSNPTRSSAGLRDPTTFKAPRDFLDKN